MQFAITRLYKSNLPFASLPSIGKRFAKVGFGSRSWELINSLRVGIATPVEININRCRHDAPLYSLRL
jgi:hypothetical protein